MKRPGARGRVAGSRRRDDPIEIALGPTLRAAALGRTGATDESNSNASSTVRGVGEAPPAGTAHAAKGPLVSRGDLRETLRREAGGRLIMLLVDCSDSMGLERRISAAKGAALSLLRRSRVTGNRVAVIEFRGTEARTVVPPTGSLHLARRALTSLGVGGATPMAAGLVAAATLLETEARLRPEGRRILILMSDGEANVPLTKGADIEAELLPLADRLSAAAHRILLLHTGESGRDLMQSLARRSRGEYHTADSFGGRDVAGFVTE